MWPPSLQGPYGRPGHKGEIGFPGRPVRIGAPLLCEGGRQTAPQAHGGHGLWGEWTAILTTVLPAGGPLTEHSFLWHLGKVSWPCLWSACTPRRPWVGTGVGAAGGVSQRWAGSALVGTDVAAKTMVLASTQQFPLPLSLGSPWDEWVQRGERRARRRHWNWYEGECPLTGGPGTAGTPSTWNGLAGTASVPLCAGPQCLGLAHIHVHGVHTRAHTCSPSPPGRGTFSWKGIHVGKNSELQGSLHSVPRYNLQ